MIKAGGFIWYDLLTTDVEAAGAFYAKVVGWKVADSGLPGLSYTLAMVGERAVGGMMLSPDGQGGPGGWHAHILVEDVDAMTEQVRKAGGGVQQPPSDIPGVGRFSAVTDPQGAAFMLFRGNGEAPAHLSDATPGAIGWRELRTTDWEGAMAFYQSLFGWRKAYAHDMGPMGTYQTFTIDDVWTGGMMNDPSGAAPHWGFYFTVEDIDAAASRVCDGGGKVLSGPHLVPSDNWVLQGTDPQGVTFGLSGPRR